VQISPWMGALLIAQADVNPYDLDNDSYIIVCKVKIALSQLCYCFIVWSLGGRSSIYGLFFSSYIDLQGIKSISVLSSGRNRDRPIMLLCWHCSRQCYLLVCKLRNISLYLFMWVYIYIYKSFLVFFRVFFFYLIVKI
jgi:hypothetical protein